jgi:hypothetical protein
MGFRLALPPSFHSLMYALILSHVIGITLLLGRHRH